MNTKRFRKSINQIPARHEPYKVLDYMWSQLNKRIQGCFRGRRFKVIFICCTASSNTIITLINRKMICMRKTRNYKLFNIPTAAGTQKKFYFEVTDRLNVWLLQTLWPGSHYSHYVYCRVGLVVSCEGVSPGIKRVWHLTPPHWKNKKLSPFH